MTDRAHGPGGPQATPPDPWRTPPSQASTSHASASAGAAGVDASAHGAGPPVLQTEVPEILQYETIRQNINQEVKVKQWHVGFFEICKEDTSTKTCALGDYCQCKFFEGFFAGRTEEELTPEEARARALEIEVRHIKKKYGDDWMKYYPYHLDKTYDDENGNPHDYGFSDDEGEDDEWWRR